MEKEENMADYLRLIIEKILMKIAEKIRMIYMLCVATVHTSI